MTLDCVFVGLFVGLSSFIDPGLLPLGSLRIRCEIVVVTSIPLVDFGCDS
jgi:hypothetical protein